MAYSGTASWHFADWIQKWISQLFYAQSPAFYRIKKNI